LPFADDLDGEYLKPFKNAFLTGAKILVGHSTLQRFAGFSYSDIDVDNHFGDDTKLKNEFFAAVGALPSVNNNIADVLRNAGKEKSFNLIQDAVKSGKW